MSPDIQELARVDHGSNPRSDGPKTMQRLVLEKNDQPLLHSPVVQDLGDGDSDSPQKLADRR